MMIELFFHLHNFNSFQALVINLVCIHLGVNMQPCDILMIESVPNVIRVKADYVMEKKLGEKATKKEGV